MKRRRFDDDGGDVGVALLVLRCWCWCVGVVLVCCVGVLRGLVL